ncbi:hypothetical protein FGO68_gene16824 [Halteria grandinella]|uniref:tRNA N(3)-methylcytidine methyltransferase n=1 Tax=Halteria grandinella TaxID=5974 RepID=A0A8J8NL30_HALGN|nr:hypothetical protein FGO68_gene16824 [Halteria grandinella]
MEERKQGEVIQEGSDSSEEEKQEIVPLKDDPVELQKLSQQSWDKFYKHNQDKFFKNRNYLSFAFEVIDQRVAEAISQDQKVSLWEVGSGTGNTVIPLHEKYKAQMSFFACDFSPNAIKLLNDLAICERAFVKDMVFCESDIAEIPSSHIDFTSMIFFLSAVHPDEQVQVMKKIALKMKAGGHILFRDYAAYDLAMMRFINKNKGILELDKMVFKRGDQTLACFFEIEKLEAIMTMAGFECIKSEYCTVQSKNIKRDLVMRRVFLNAIFRKKSD